MRLKFVWIYLTSGDGQTNNVNPLAHSFHQIIPFISFGLNENILFRYVCNWDAHSYYLYLSCHKFPYIYKILRQYSINNIIYQPPIAAWTVWHLKLFFFHYVCYSLINNFHQFQWKRLRNRNKQVFTAKVLITWMNYILHLKY